MNPLIILAGLALLLALAARWKSIYPNRALVIVAGVPALLSLAIFAVPALLWPIVAVDLIALAVAIADLLSLPRQKHFAVERSTGRIASLRQPHRVELVISNLSEHSRTAWLRDGTPAGLQRDPEEFLLILEPRSRSTVHYQLTASRRGAFELSQAFLRVRSRWGLWQRHLTYSCESRIHVYPDMKQLAEYSLLARTNRLSLMGMRRTRKIGGDNEFERLRDYTFDDNYKHIDWRSTARRNKLTVKDFQANQSQRIIFLVDCGRMMTGHARGLSLLDHSLNAMLMLSYVALRQGDQVGLLCFSDRIHSFVPPGGGMNHMNQLLHSSFDRFPQMVESRYDQAFLYLASHCRKRALVVLITNIIDEVNANQIQRYLTNLVGRHLPLGVLLRDRGVFDALEGVDPKTAAADDPQLYRAAAAADILTWRHQVLTDLEMKGVLSVDVFPEDMSAPLVNRYLDIKARHLL